MKLIRLWRLARSYKRIHRLEAKLNYCTEVVELRRGFAAQTVRFYDAMQKHLGISRQVRRATQRKIAAGKTS